VTGSSDGPGAAGFLPEEEPEEEEGVEVDTRRPRVVTVAFWLLLAAAVLRAAVGESELGTTPVSCVYVWFAVRVRRGLGKPGSASRPPASGSSSYRGHGRGTSWTRSTGSGGGTPCW
jgi:hypothetical protein